MLANAATCGEGEALVRLWSVTTDGTVGLRVQRDITMHGIPQHVGLVCDRLVVAIQPNAHKTTLRAFNMVIREAIALSTATPQTDEVAALAVSPTLRRLATASKEGVLKVWDTNLNLVC